MKLPCAASLQDRVRVHDLGVSIVALSQGIPFFHAGIDMLRSKSLDRNSYNSGDWFNRLDFTYQSNNWGVGLPPAQDNQSNWPIMGPLLARPDPAEEERLLKLFWNRAELKKEGVTFAESDAAFLAGIPGTVGGALAMNAGAHGGETWQRVRAVQTIDRAGNVQFRGGSQNFNPSFAKAARVAIVEVDEIVEPGEIAPELIEQVRKLSVAYRLKRDASAGRALDRLLKNLSADQTVSVIRAFSYFSHLANIAEDRHHVRRREHHERLGHLQEGSLAMSFERLARGGVQGADGELGVGGVDQQRELDL